MVWTIFQNLVIFQGWVHEMHTRIHDFMAFRRNASHRIALDVGVNKKDKERSGFLKVHYHDKGIEMIGLPQILNSRYVKDAVPQCLTDREPPMVSYSYSRTVSGRLFN